MGSWTLNYNGSEQAFPAWNIRADVMIELVSKGRWVCRVPTTEAYDAVTPQFAYGEPVTIWQNRTAVGSGGHIYFQGWVGKITRMSEGPRQGIVYEFYDIWWKLERQTMRQVRNAATNYDSATGAWTYGTPQFLTEVYLGELVNLAGETVSLMTNGEEISEILSWLNECNNPTRRGNAYDGHSSSITAGDDLVNFWGRPGAGIWPPSAGLPAGAIDSGNGNAVMDPQSIIPVTRVQNISCAEAIINMLRWSPSVTVSRDFTSASPLATLHFRDQLGTNALALVTITLTVAQERQIQTRPENERVLPGVIIEYRRVSTINGQPYLQYELDTWPGTITQFTPEVLFQFVELAGASVTQVSADVEVTDVADATSAVSATQLGFWSEYEPLLKNNPNVSGITFNNSSFTAQEIGSNTGIDLATYPNVLLPKSSIAPWMQAIVVEDAVLSIQVGFTQTNDGGQTTHVTTRYIHARVKLTNAVTQTYTGITHLDTGDPFPPTGASGLAKQIYAGLSSLTHSGRITILESQLASGDLSGIVPGAPLKLAGPNNTYSNLFIQSVRCRPHHGELDIEYGPAARLDAADLIELWRCTRLRLIYNMPSGRGTGQPGSGPSVDATTDIGVENTSAPPGDNTYLGLWG